MAHAFGKKRVQSFVTNRAMHSPPLAIRSFRQAHTSTEKCSETLRALQTACSTSTASTILTVSRAQQFVNVKKTCTTARHVSASGADKRSKKANKKTKWAKQSGRDRHKRHNAMQNLVAADIFWVSRVCGAACMMHIRLNVEVPIPIDRHEACLVTLF